MATALVRIGILISACVTTGFAQDLRAKVQGNVTDLTGTVVPVTYTVSIEMSGFRRSRLRLHGFSDGRVRTDSRGGQHSPGRAERAMLDLGNISYPCFGPRHTVRGSVAYSEIARSPAVSRMVRIAYVFYAAHAGQDALELVL